MGLQGGFLCLVVEEADGGCAAEGHHVSGKVIMCSVEVKTQSSRFQALVVHVGQVTHQVLLGRLAEKETTNSTKIILRNTNKYFPSVCDRKIEKFYEVRFIISVIYHLSVKENCQILHKSKMELFL